MAAVRFARGGKGMAVVRFARGGKGMAVVRFARGGKGMAIVPFARGGKGIASDPPLVDQYRICGEVGNLGRHGCEGGLEDSRQAEKGRMAVESGQGRAIFDYPIQARAVRQKASKRLLTGHQHVSSAPLDQLRVADELDSIPQPLLGMQEDRSTLERSTVPDRLIERANPTCPALRAPFVLIPSPRKVAHLQPGHGPVQVRLGQAWREAKRLLVALNGFGKPSLCLKHKTEMVVGARVVRLVVQGAKIAIHRLIEQPLRLECVAQIVMSLRIPWLESQRLLETRRCFLRPAQRLKRDAQVVPRLGVGGHEA